MHPRKILFIHIPKTAGTSIAKSGAPFLESADEIHVIDTCGAAAKIEQRCLEDRFKFAFTRNPWDRLVSLYHYFFYMEANHPYYKYDKRTVKLISKFKTFRGFCLGLNELIPDLDRLPEGVQFHFYDQSKWTHDIDGGLILDFVGRFESLQSDFNSLCKMMNVQPVKLNKVNESPHKPYWTYYDDETEEIVTNKYRKDIDNFNYSFKG